MDNNEHINKLIHDALNSVDSATRATPKPFLFTRLQAKMQYNKDTVWDRALAFINKPVIAFATLCLLLCINAIVITAHYQNKTKNSGEAQYASVDEYSNPIATINEIENTEP